MNYLVTNPFCPYCYGNDRLLEKEIPNLNDEDLLILPMHLTPDVQEFDNILYEKYKKAFNTQTVPYLKEIGVEIPTYFKLENVAKSELVFISYYYLREFNLGLKFYREVTKRFYTSDFNYGNIDNLATIVSELGHDPEAYKKAIHSQAYYNMYLENLDLVDESGIDSVPTYIIDDEVTMFDKVQDAINKLKENIKKEH